MGHNPEITRRILDWYGHNQRDLPWRHTRNPYNIWVSEIMLQQTRVDTVIPYYRRFLSRFPTIESLARAPLQDVLKVWENLGYYSRARHLHDAAKRVTSLMGGVIPKTWPELLALPGIGPYTGAAILSIAFDQQVAAVDANVRRVICRIFAVMERIDLPGVQKRIHGIATALIPPKEAARFNQGIMDFGATLCTPQNPACVSCPLQDLCLAFKRGCQSD
ncbi:MAG TPA: A/G-specific adenine glycosylase, partial [Desulfobacteraceae bacterium]|nr:A/G-specific adenine glycosylase [Desulfobacteraceae bacterium]